MQAELNLEIPYVGCVIIPIVSLHSKEGSKVIPDDKLCQNLQLEYDYFEEFFMPKLEEIGCFGIHKSKTFEANVHASADPQNTDVKLWQNLLLQPVGALIEDLERNLAHSIIPVLIYADLNSLPRSAAHTLVVNGWVDLKHEELVNTPDGIIEHLKVAHKLLPLASAYSSFSRTKNGDMMDSDTKEPRFTTSTLYFRNTVDLHFLNRGYVEVVVAIG
ncbi:hypothetical protein C5167_012107 [Papaver somniferum]|uniref:Endonuclease/exonuclease/phosphatase domain-containing protein n=1 Tax=Papaver somniferum TaxID=3469 RepID=A0A4Y7IX70_PAPSO|nr:hypothetical protein C5167_012107 [Papaver somniferum]